MTANESIQKFIQQKQSEALARWEKYSPELQRATSSNFLFFLEGTASLLAESAVELRFWQEAGRFHAVGSLDEWLTEETADILRFARWDGSTSPFNRITVDVTRAVRSQALYSLQERIRLCRQFEAEEGA